MKGKTKTTFSFVYKCSKLSGYGVRWYYLRSLAAASAYLVAEAASVKTSPSEAICINVPSAAASSSRLPPIMVPVSFSMPLSSAFG